MESRRRFLKSAMAIIVAGGVLVAADGIVKLTSLMKSESGAASSSPSINDTTAGRASLISVRVYYSMMAAYTDTSDELFVLQSPATLQNLLDTVVVRHPSLGRMMRTMLTLVNGVPSQSSAPLKDGDEVQFIPMTAGG